MLGRVLVARTAGFSSEKGSKSPKISTKSTVNRPKSSVCRPDLATHARPGRDLPTLIRGGGGHPTAGGRRLQPRCCRDGKLYQPYFAAQNPRGFWTLPCKEGEMDGFTTLQGGGQLEFNSKRPNLILGSRLGIRAGVLSTCNQTRSRTRSGAFSGDIAGDRYDRTFILIYGRRTRAWPKLKRCPSPETNLIGFWEGDGKNELK
jgi:hypothetical protein